MSKERSAAITIGGKEYDLVPLYMASMMASLYPASSKGEVSSSTASWVSGSFLSSGRWRLWISTL